MCVNCKETPDKFKFINFCFSYDKFVKSVFVQISSKPSMISLRIRSENSFLDFQQTSSLKKFGSEASFVSPQMMWKMHTSKKILGGARKKRKRIFPQHFSFYEELFCFVLSERKIPPLVNVCVSGPPLGWCGWKRTVDSKNFSISDSDLFY